jgi:hypothetical protein
MITTRTMRRHVTLLLLPILLLTHCGRAPAETIASRTASATPPSTLSSSQQQGLLSIVSPLGSTEVSGGQDLRITLRLVDDEDQPVGGAEVRTELWRPDGKMLASVPCADQGEGHYLCEYVRLPLRGAGGAWRVMSHASWDDGHQAKAEGTFQAGPSVSEMYQERHGFWIEHPRVLGLGTGFYNLAQSGGLHFEDWLNEDGSGYVILDNYRYESAGVTFATLEVHWRREQFPVDAKAASAFAQTLAGSGLHHHEPDTPLVELTASSTTFQGRPAWQVSGQGQEYYVAAAAAAYPVECLVFGCPGSGWLWSLVLATDREPWMDHLRALLETFECPASDGGQG